MNEFTVEEDMILDYLADGLTNTEIARLLGLKLPQLNRRIKNIGLKLGIYKFGTPTRMEIKEKIMNWRIE